MINQTTISVEENVQEWISLMQYAKELGLTTEEVKDFLLQNKST
ncbi:DNA-binding anti-repressor SinI [Priestia flexa]|nr:DNA-binding anti-repressor SinI [Priestia flexa]MDT2047837.1 DNA-binding anti-repressor SinI [Priestia flexa]USY56071.1 DNA-binding anti-repressor SinI [Bacillus sp. 1780r2a1]